MVTPHGLRFMARATHPNGDPIDPQPKGSKSAVPTAKGMRVIEGRSKRSRDRYGQWNRAVVTAVTEALEHAGGPVDGPVSVTLSFAIRRPRAHYRTGRYSDLLRDDAPTTWHTQKPDIDKLARSVLDSIVKAGAITDDQAVVALYATKEWVDRHPVRGNGPGVVGTIQPVR